MIKEDELRKFCEDQLIENHHITAGSLLGKAYYVDKTFYDRYDKAYAFVQKERQIIIQKLKERGYNID